MEASQIQWFTGYILKIQRAEKENKETFKYKLILYIIILSSISVWETSTIFLVILLC